MLRIQDTYVCPGLALVNILTTQTNPTRNETIKLVEKEEDEGVMIWIDAWNLWTFYKTIKTTQGNFHQSKNLMTP